MRLLRRAGLLFGFGVLGLLGATEYALSRRDGAKPGPIDDSDIGYVSADSVSSPSRAVARLRVVLGALGAVLMLGGTLTATFLALSDARPDLATLSAVGASPRTRRGVAAAYATESRR